MNGIRIPAGWSPIGIDIRQRTIATAQLHSAGMDSPATLTTAWTMSRQSSGPSLSEHDLHRLLERIDISGMHGRDVVLACPHEHELLAVLELPPLASGLPIQRLMHQELARVHRKEPALLLTDGWVIPSPERARSATHLMAAGILSEHAQGLTNAFVLAGLSPLALDVRCCALARCIGAAQATSGSLRAGIEVTHDRATVVLLHPADDTPTLVYERTIESGGLSHLIDALVRKLGIDERSALALAQGTEQTKAPSDALASLTRASRGIISEFFDALVSESQRSILYAAQRYPSLALPTIWLAGPGVRVRGLGERLSAALGASVKPLLLGSIARTHRRSTLGDEADCAVACGLAASPALNARSLREPSTLAHGARGPVANPALSGGVS